MQKFRSFIIPFMILIMLAIINSGRAIGATGGLDSDGDGVLNSGDNCPLTANPDQADANGNGIGDVCDAPFPDGFAYVTPQGVVQTKTDACLRPVTILSPDAVLTLSWSGDASHFDLTIEGKTFPVDIDFSDSALLEAISAYEAETGQDLSAMRTWIAQNPGLVSAVARCEKPPPGITSISMRSWTHPQDFPAEPEMNIEDRRMDNYLDRLDLAASIAFEVWIRFKSTHTSSEVSLARQVLVDNWVNLETFAYAERMNCNPCGQSLSYYLRPQVLAHVIPIFQIRHAIICPVLIAIAAYPGATFDDGKECPGACYITSTLTGYTCCVWTDQMTCDEIPWRGGDVTTIFIPGLTCLGDPCSSR